LRSTYDDVRSMATRPPLKLRPMRRFSIARNETRERWTPDLERWTPDLLAD